MTSLYLDPELKNLTIEQIEEINKNNKPISKWNANNSTEPMIPREYQYEILKKAISENIIAVLDTGAGKTLISVMLIKHMLSIEDENCRTIPNYKRKISFFLVERVPLVFQQYNVLESNCDARIKKMCGEMNVDTWSKEKWLAIFDNTDICIMTAQIFPDILQRGFLSLERVNLLIFDECHHATKGHPYNLTMHQFYHRMKGVRPKIFGMTASPAGKADVDKSIITLETNLDAKVYTAIQTKELADAINKPSEQIVYYSMEVIDDLPDQRNTLPITLRYPRTILTSLIYNKLRNISGFDNCIKVIDVISNNLGPWCGDVIWRDMLYSSYITESNIDNNMVYTRKYSKNDTKLLKEAYELTNNHFISKPDINNSRLFTSKVQELIKCLTIIHKQAEFHGIIFVERRQTAKSIKLLIESLNVFKDSIRCDIMVGHGGLNNTIGNVHMKLNDQHDIIQKFRTGELNLIIATSVAEEGLDIQACNYVIRFDLFKTPAAYIQSRGRARRKDAKYILLINRQNPKDYNLLSKFQDIEKRMKVFCRSLPADRNVAQLFSDEYNPDLIIKEASEKFLKNAYEISSTGVILTLYSSIALVYHYCDSLPSDQFCNFKPVYKITEENPTLYHCLLTLPINSKKTVFEGYGDSKREAKMNVSLLACIELHKLGAIDDNLIPVNIKNKRIIIEERDEEGKQVGSRGREAIYPKKIPSFWNIPNSYLNGVLLGPYWVSYIAINDNKFRKMCLITKSPLPPISKIELQNYIEVKIDRLETQFKFEKIEQVELLVKYMFSITKAVTNKEFTCSMKDIPYFLAPLKANGSFDWKEIKNTINFKNIPIIVDTKILQDTILINSSGKIYFFEKVEVDMTPNSILKNETTFAEYFETEKDIIIKNLHQPLLLVTQVMKDESENSEISSFLIPELCQIYSLSASVYRSLQTLPTITSRIDATLLALDTKKSINSSDISNTLMIEAYSASSAGLNINYQRLEFLGDSVLKLIASTFVFVQNIHSNEDELTVARTSMISNKALFRSANQLKLYQYICSQTLPRRFWRPPHFVTASDSEQIKQVLRFHKLSDKTLADVIESTLGAAYITDKSLKIPLKTARHLRVPLETVHVWSDFNKLFKKQKFISTYDPLLRECHIERVTEIIGYKFKNPGLIVEALTHASVPSSSVPCYQRLEFLGDAVLDFCVTDYLFKKYNTAPPGLLHNLRKSSVNNDILSVLCVQLGLHTHIRHGSSYLMDSMLNFVQLVKASKDKKGEYWLDFNPPKVLSDIIESLIGAVYIDCDFQLEPVIQLFERWLKPLLDDHISLESIQEHPVGKLKYFVQAYGCVQCETKNITQNASEPKKCIVFIHRKAFTSGSGFNTREARKEAATRACELLLQDDKLLPLLCNCKTVN